MKKRYLMILFIAVVICAFSLFGELLTSPRCTIFTVEEGDRVFYGNNEDWHAKDLVIGFFPESEEGFGSVHFGHLGSRGQALFEGAVNDRGLAWDINSVPKMDMIEDPDKAFHVYEDNFFYQLTKTAASVEEAIALAEKFNFGTAYGSQIHIADKYGDAVVIGPGQDGQLAYTRKKSGDGYLLSTNFNLATPDKGPKDFRYELATEMLDGFSSDKSVYDLGRILEAVSLHTLTTFTLYSNVYDLVEGDLYIYYMSQYNHVLKMNIEEELSKGKRVINLRELFPEAVANAGDDAYRIFSSTFYLVMAIVILLIVGLAYASGRFILKRIKK